MTIFHRRHYLFPGKTSIQENYGNSENQTPQFVGSGPRRLGLLPNHPPSEIRSDHDRIQTAPRQNGTASGQCVAPVLLTGGDYYLQKVQRAIDSDLSVLKNAIGALERAARHYTAHDVAQAFRESHSGETFSDSWNGRSNNCSPTADWERPGITGEPGKVSRSFCTGRPVVRRLHRRTGRRLRTMAQKDGALRGIRFRFTCGSCVPYTTRRSAKESPRSAPLSKKSIRA